MEARGIFFQPFYYTITPSFVIEPLYLFFFLKQIKKNFFYLIL